MRTDRNAYVELLVLCAQDGDRQALAALVDHWHLRLSRYALHMTGDVEASVEVMQEVWLAVVRSLRRLDDPARFGSWAYRIVGNKCNDSSLSFSGCLHASPRQGPMTRSRRP